MSIGRLIYQWVFRIFTNADSRKSCDYNADLVLSVTSQHMWLMGVEDWGYVKIPDLRPKSRLRHLAFSWCLSPPMFRNQNWEHHPPCRSSVVVSLWILQQAWRPLIHPLVYILPSNHYVHCNVFNIILTFQPYDAERLSAYLLHTCIALWSRYSFTISLTIPHATHVIFTWVYLYTLIPSSLSWTSEGWISVLLKRGMCWMGSLRDHVIYKNYQKNYKPCSKHIYTYT